MDDFESLSGALDGWFEVDWTELPAPLQERVRKDFFPMSWDQLAPDQRRYVAGQWDQKHDPALVPERQRAWDLVCESFELEAQIERWQSVATPTAKDLDIKEAKLLDLRRALQRVQSRLRGEKAAALPNRSERTHAPRVPEKGSRYIAYPAALARLRTRLNATPEEMAAWIYAGSQDSGLAAYVNANELDPPPRFHFPDAGLAQAGEGHDYVSPMMGCWFLADEIEEFQPLERYIIGRDLIARWSKVIGLNPAAYIRAKISESRLLDAHPIYGATQGTFPEEADFPPMELGLHRVSEVEAIEQEDFGSGGPSNAMPGSTENRRQRVRERVSALRNAGAKAFLKTVAKEEGLSVSRIKQLLDDGAGKRSALKPPATWIAPISQRDRSSWGKKKRQT